MKIKRINTAFLLLALAGMTLAGCSNEDIANVTPQKETGNVTFSIVEKDYEPATDNPKTRAAAEETKSVTQDLGDGLMAEVSLVPDTTHRATAPKTRAISTPTHYTIQAFQGGVKKGELKGTFNGSTFTPDAGQPEAIGLPHGTYDFVCFNDDVTSNGTQLTVNRSAAATARFTVKRGVVINQDPKQQVEFTLKHAGAIISYYLLAEEFGFEGIITNTQTTTEWGEAVYVCDFANEEDRIKYKIESAASTVPSTMVYDFATDTYSYPTTEQISKSANAALGTIPVAYTTPGNGFGTGSIRVPADYYLPSTNCADIKLTFTHGKIGGGNLAGKSITIPTSKLVEANKVYRVLVRFYLADRYLYSDGSYGPRSQNSTKTPIAVIVSDRIAIALHDVNEGGAEQLQWGSNTTSSEGYSWNHVCENYADLFDFNQNGKAENATGAAKSAVSGYTPVAPSPRRWGIPTLVNFLQMGITLGRMNEGSFGDLFSYWSSGKGYAFFAPSGAAATGFSPAPSTANFPAMDMTRFNNAFTNVGGTPPSGTYWTYMECKDGTEYKMATIEISGGKFHLGLKSKTETAKVRPVIYY